MERDLLNSKPAQLVKNLQLHKTIKGTLKYGLSGFGGLSLLSLVGEGIKTEWVIPIYNILQQYEVLVENFRIFFEPILLPIFYRVASYFNFEIILAPHWPDIVLMMVIYLRARVSSYFGGSKYFRGILMMLVATLYSIFTACIAASIQIDSYRNILISTSIPLMGFAFYDLTYATIGATFDKQSRSWFSEYWRHIVFSVPLLIMLLVVNVVLAAITLKIGFTGYQSFVFIICAHYCFISLYWSHKAWAFAKVEANRRYGESIKERFWRSSATTVSWYVALSIAVALVFFLSNAGLRVVGLPSIQAP